MQQDFDGNQAFEHVRRLSVDIGPRMMGSPADHRAADYVHEYFASLGLPVIEQAFEVETGELLSHKVEVIEPRLGDVRCFPALLNPDTPDDGLIGDLVFVEGEGEPQAGPHLKGKIVLWASSPAVHGMAVLKYEPLALLRVSQTVGVMPKQFETTAEDAKPWSRVPTFQVTYEEALRLVKQGARKVRVSVQSRCRMGTTRNVIAEVKGTHHPDEIIVIGGHLDTTPYLPGATDNASGSAVVMELARLYAQRGSKRTLRFVTWAGEEGGLLGSRHYMRMLKAKDKQERSAPGFVKGRDKTELEQHVCAICLDVVGMTVGHSSCHVHGPSELTAAMSILAAELGIPHDVTDSQYGSDHLPFAAANVPSLAMARKGGAALYMHTPQDDIDLLDPQHLGEVGHYTDTFVRRFASEGQVWPFKREVPEPVRKRISEELEKWEEESTEEKAK
jgi:aminopeptidase YwaD